MPDETVGSCADLVILLTRVPPLLPDPEQRIPVQVDLNGSEGSIRDVETS